MTDKALLDRLARESRQAALAAEDALPDPQDRRSPALGSIWALPEVDSPFVVLQRDPADGERFLAVPADYRRQVGTRDVLVAGRDQEAPLVLRCAYPLWLNQAQLNVAAAVGLVDESSRAQALKILQGESSDHPERIDVDEETAYRTWAEEGPRADRERLLARARRHARLPLAAAIAGLLTLGAWAVTQQLRRDSPPETVLASRGPEILIGDTHRGSDDFEVPTRDYWQLPLYWAPEVPSYPEYRVELSDSAGRRIATQTLTEDDRPDAVFLVATRKLKAGLHTLRVFGLRDGEATLLAEQPLPLVEPNAP